MQISSHLKAEMYSLLQKSHLSADSCFRLLAPHQYRAGHRLAREMPLGGYSPKRHSGDLFILRLFSSFIIKANSHNFFPLVHCLKISLRTSLVLFNENQHQSWANFGMNKFEYLSQCVPNICTIQHIGANANSSRPGVSRWHIACHTYQWWRGDREERTAVESVMSYVYC